MAAADDIELLATIKGLLVSRVTVIKANELHRECEVELGKAFPFKSLETFVDYLRSIPNAVQLEPHSGYNPNVYPVTSGKSRHIEQMVARQRIPQTKRSRGGRRPTYNSRPPPRRRPIVQPSRPAGLEVQTKKLPFPFGSLEVRSQSIISSLYPSPLQKGIHVRDLEDYMTRNYDNKDRARNGLQSADHLLPHAGGFVERRDTKVYPKLAYEFNNNGHSSAVNAIPAGMEDDFDDYDDEYQFDQEEMGMDSEEEESERAIKLWSSALAVKQSEETTRSEPLRGGTLRKEVKDELVEQLLYAQEDESNISSGMIKNFRKILDQYPNDGIWASQLQQLYFDNFHVPLDLLDLGYTNVIKLAESLPSVFSFKREGSDDWKLYDARYFTQESLDAQTHDGDKLFSEHGVYVPPTIIKRIKKLLEEYPNGFRSIDLLPLYEETFNKPLNLHELGYKTVNEFLTILKDDVTLRKVNDDYCLLLPKHIPIPYEAIQSCTSDELLNIPGEVLGIPIPSNVLQRDDEIPMQELPQMNFDPSQPLLELQVQVAEVISPTYFYMILDEMHEELEKMMDDLHKFYLWEEANFVIPKPNITLNLHCASKYNEYWHRVKITKVMDQGNTAEVEYIDYGTPLTVKSSELRFLSKEFAALPAQAICAKLMGLKPKNEKIGFPKDVCAEFLRIVSEKRLVAHVYNITERVRRGKERIQLELILFEVENSEEIVINDYLVENGYADVFTKNADSAVKDQSLEEHEPMDDFTSLKECDASVSLFGASTSPPENVSHFEIGEASTSLPTSSVDPTFQTLLHNSSPSPSPRIPPLTLPPNKTQMPSTYLEANTGNKPRRPPPGFEGVLVGSDFSNTAAPQPRSEAVTASHQLPLVYQPSTDQTSRPSPNFFPNEELLRHHNYSQRLPEYQQSAFPPNPSNMPYEGTSFYQNLQGRGHHPLNYRTVPPPNPHQNPPQNVFHNTNPNFYTEPVYFTTTHPSLPYPTLGTYIQQWTLTTVPPTSYVALHQPPSRVGNTGNVLQFGQNVVSVPPPNFQPSLSISAVPPSPPPTIIPPVASISSYVPEHLSENRGSVTNTASFSCHRVVPAPPKKSQSPKVTEALRPSTPLTPASAEVANICKLSRPSSSSGSSASCHRRSQSTGSQRSRSSLHTSESPNNSCAPHNIFSYSQTPSNRVENATNTFQIVKVEDDSENYVNLPVDEEYNSQAHTEINEVIIPEIKEMTTPYVKVTALPTEMKQVFKPPPTPETLYSAVSSPVDSLIRASPFKEESSDDYASASENTIGEVNQQMNNMILTLQASVSPLKPACDASEDIPDSWENLDLDDSPVKSDNVKLDLSQPVDSTLPLDLIIDNLQKSESSLRENNSVKQSVSETETLESPFKINVPTNWKDFFNPDAICSFKKVDNENNKKEKSSSEMKINVKKIAVQEIEVQRKRLHLLIINNSPAVVALEFFKQFGGSNNPQVSEKVVEVSSHNKMYVISKAQHPDILAELNKVPTFHGGLDKKTVIRLNSKVKVLNLSDIPQCLKTLNVSNKALLDNLQKISIELQSS